MKNRMIKLGNRVRNITFGIGVFGIFLFGMSLDTEGIFYKYIIIGMIISLLFFIVSFVIDRLVDYLSNDYYEYDTTDYNKLCIEMDNLDGYYNWLHINNYRDTEKAYDFYCNNIM